MSIFRRSAAVVCVLLLLLGCIQGVPCSAKTADAFVRVEGTRLMCGKDEYIIKGMALGNNVWSYPTNAPVNDHDESTYKELAALGFNSVRFYMNYQLFESDTAPGVRRKEGFDWIDKNLRWAKRYNIRLILNMHCPQGGFQSQGNGDALWTDTSNRKRLIALWGDIAKHYADEPFIIGYGLVNEPIPVGKTSSRDGITVWKELAGAITKNIRKYDKKHLIFVEKVLSVKDPATMESDWSIPEADKFVKIDDPSTVYEFHTYDPFSFTHQGFEWAGTGGTYTSYPSDEISAQGSKWLSCTSSDPANTSITGIQTIKSSRISISDKRTNVIAAAFRAAGIGSGGKAYAWDIYIDDYSPSGELVKSIPCSVTGFGFWSSDGSGSCTAEDGKLCISGTESDANMTKIMIEHIPGHTYTIRGKIQIEKAVSGASVSLRIDSYHAESITKCDRSLLERSVSEAAEFSRKNNVPVYCGEFGAGINCFTEDRGGSRWVSDMLDIFSEYGMNFNYHAYNDGAFGLYRTENGKRIKNTGLEKVFAEKLK